MTDSRALIQRIEGLLNAALGCLESRVESPEEGVGPGGQLLGSRSQFDGFMDHGEYELAWDAIADVADRETASRQFWAYLAEAASIMELEKQEGRAETHLRPEGSKGPEA